MKLQGLWPVERHGLFGRFRFRFRRGIALKIYHESSDVSELVRRHTVSARCENECAQNPELPIHHGYYSVKAPDPGKEEESNQNQDGKEHRHSVVQSFPPSQESVIRQLATS